MPPGSQEQAEAAKAVDEMLVALQACPSRPLTRKPYPPQTLSSPQANEAEAAEFKLAAKTRRQGLIPQELRQANREKIQVLGYDIAMEVFDSDSSDEEEHSDDDGVNRADDFTALIPAENNAGAESEGANAEAEEDDDDEKNADLNSDEDGADVYGLQRGVIGLVPQRDAPLAKYRLKLMPFNETNAEEIEVEG